MSKQDQLSFSQGEDAALFGVGFDLNQDPAWKAGYCTFDDRWIGF